MNNVVKIWDVYDTPKATGAVKHDAEEVRLKKEVERLNSTIAALERERDANLKTIEELKRSKPRAISVPRRITCPKPETVFVTRNQKTQADTLKEVKSVASELHNEGIVMLRKANYKHETNDGKYATRLICASQQILDCVKRGEQ